MKTHLSLLDSFIILSIYGISLFFFGFVCFKSIKYFTSSKGKEKQITYHKKTIKPTQQVTEISLDSVSACFIIIQPLEQKTDFKQSYVNPWASRSF